MTKYVFSNEQTCHVWAQRNQSHGRGPSINFDGDTIYSYGTHFPMAHFYDVKDDTHVLHTVVFINSDSYSSSTGKHQGYMRRALRGEEQRIYVDTATIKELRYYSNTKSSDTPQVVDLLYKSALKSVNSAIAAAKSQQKRYAKITRMRHMATAIQERNQFFNNVRLLMKPTKKLLNSYKFPKMDDAVFDELRKLEQIDAVKKQAAYEIRQEIQQAAYEREKEKNKDNLAKWLNGEQVTTAFFSDTWLRVQGEEIVSSRGARFPIDHAKRVFALVRMCKVEQCVFVRSSVSRFETQLGSFRVDSVDDQGNVKAGCHYVKWDAIQRVAMELGLWP